MIFYITTLLFIILISILLIIIISIYNQYQDYIIRINEAEANIDAVLRKRFDLLNKSIGVIKKYIDESEEDVLKIIDKLRSQKLTNFELDRKLYEAINEFNNYGNKITELKQCEEYTKIEINLIESESEIVALRRYYNDIITNYNSLVKKFPSNIVATIKKYPVKTYFDGKNMEDDILNDFKL